MKENCVWRTGSLRHIFCCAQADRMHICDFRRIFVAISPQWLVTHVYPWLRLAYCSLARPLSITHGTQRWKKKQWITVYKWYWMGECEGKHDFQSTMKFCRIAPRPPILNTHIRRSVRLLLCCCYLPVDKWCWPNFVPIMNTKRSLEMNDINERSQMSIRPQFHFNGNNKRISSIVPIFFSFFLSLWHTLTKSIKMISIVLLLLNI